MRSPLFIQKYYDHPSVFNAKGLLREARRQKSIPQGKIPDICVLDPDGDLANELETRGVRINPYWACYHTKMFELYTPTGTVGVIGGAVGASFAVLVAEQLFVSGCKLLISITSAGEIQAAEEPPYFILIDRALRDEGTSHHYVPSQYYARPSSSILNFAENLSITEQHIIRGGTWTTDAPFRETKEAIDFARSEGLLAVEMEAAGLYAFSEAKRCEVLCFAYVTNRMATVENDFEKGEASGNKALISLINSIAKNWSTCKKCKKTFH